MGGKKLKQSFIARVAFIFLIGLPSFAFANYDKQCDISFQSYVSPSIAGCIFSAKKSGELSFKLLGRSVTSKKCFSAAGMGNEQINQFIEMIKGENFVGEKGLLFVREQGDFISGKLTTNSFPNEGLKFPQIKKDSGGSAKATLDTGVNIKLTVKNSAADERAIALKASKLAEQFDDGMPLTEIQMSVLRDYIQQRIEKHQKLDRIEAALIDDPDKNVYYMWGQIKRRCLKDDTIAWPHATAAKYGRCSRTQVSKIMNKLTKLGAVTRPQEGKRGANSGRAAIYRREI